MLEVIREEKSVSEIASENGIHPNQIRKWRKQALENFVQLFEDNRKGERVRELEHEKQIEELMWIRVFRVEKGQNKMG